MWRFGTVAGVVVVCGACKVDTEVRAQLPPTLSDAELTTAEDTTATLTLDGSDPSGDPVTYTVTTDPEHGDVTIDGDVLTYTPDPDYFGDDVLIVLPTAARLDGEVATVSITVDPVNDAPVTEDFAVTLLEDESVTDTLLATDVDSESLTFAVQTDVAHGTLTLGVDGALTYVPEPGFGGEDTFTFTVSDGIDATSASGTFTVVSVDEPPIASDDTLTLDEDTSTTGQLLGSDPDGDPLVFAVATTPTHGTLVIDDAATGAFTYTPAADYAGNDTATFTVTASGVESPAATLSIIVDPVNDAPVTADVSWALLEDEPYTDQLTASDIDSASLTFAVSVDAEHGTLAISPDGAVSYTPDAGFSGTDSFTFTVSDGIATTSGTATLSVGAVDDPPVAVGDVLTLDEDTSATGSLTGSDPDGDALTFAVDTEPSHGSFVLDDPSTGAFTYTPDANYAGSDTVTFIVTANGVDSAPATLAITVDPVNDAPVTDDMAVTVDEDAVLTTTLVATDIDSTALLWTAEQPDEGTASVAGNVLTYTPSANFNTGDRGPVLVPVTVSDGVLTASATVSITVTPVNDPPIVVDGLSYMYEDSEGVRFTPITMDFDGDDLTLFVEDAPSMGTATVDGDTFVYVPALNAEGTDTFTFRAFDGETTSNLGTFTAEIEWRNDAPVAVADTYTAVRNLELVIPASEGLLSNDTDVDGDTLHVDYGGSTTAMGGTVQSARDGSFIYRIGPGALGTDTFTYTVEDGLGGETTGTVSIELTDSFRVVGAEGSTGPWVAPVHTTLGAAASASHDGETIYVLANTPADDGWVTVPSSVRLLGQALPLVIDGQTLVPAGATPLLTNRVTLGADGTEVGGFDLSAWEPLTTADRADVSIHDMTLTTDVGDCIVGTNATRLTVTDVSVGGCIYGMDLSGASAVLERVDVDDVGTGVYVFQGTSSLEIRDSVLHAINNTVYFGPAGGSLTMESSTLEGKVSVFTTLDTEVTLSDLAITTVTEPNLRLDASGTGTLSVDGADLSLQGGSTNGALSIRSRESGRLEGDFSRLTVATPNFPGAQMLALDTSQAQVMIRESAFTSAVSAMSVSVQNQADAAFSMQDSNLVGGSFSTFILSSSSSVSPRLGLLNVNTSRTMSLQTTNAPLILGDTTPVGTAGVDTDGGAIARTGNTTGGGAPDVYVSGTVLLTDLYGLPGFQ